MQTSSTATFSIIGRGTRLVECNARRVHSASKISPNLEIKLAVSPIPDCSSEYHWPEKSLNQHCHIAVHRQGGCIRSKIGFSDFVVCDQIQIASQQRRQLPQPSNISRLEQEVLARQKCIVAICRQPQRPAKRKWWHTYIVISERRSPGRGEKHVGSRRPLQPGDPVRKIAFPGVPSAGTFHA